MDYAYYHPVMGIQAALNNDRHLTAEPPPEVQHMANDQTDATGFGVNVAIDSTPKYVAAIGLGAIAVMALLQVAGFRFSFGVSGGR